MTLVDNEKAIQCLASYGPVFGAGDIAVCDSCDKNHDSTTNFPSSFNNDGLYNNDQIAKSSLCGVREGNHFKVV